METALKRLEDPRPEAQLAAQKALVKLGPSAIGPLSAVLHDKARAWPVRTGVAWVLGELQDPKAKAALERAWALEGAPDTFRMQVAIALGTLGDVAPLKSYITGTKTPPVMLAKAAIALANLGDRDSVAAIKPHASHPQVGPFIKLALGRLGEPSVKADLTKMLKEPMFRDHAALGLATLGDKTVIFQLRYALDSPDPHIRRDALRFLGKLGDVPSLKTARKLAKSDPDPRVREVAVRAVKRMERAKRRKR